MGKTENNQEDDRFEFNHINNYSKFIWNTHSNLTDRHCQVGYKEARPMLSIKTLFKNRHIQVEVNKCTDIPCKY